MSLLPDLPTANVKQIYLPATAVDSQGNAVPQDQQDWVKMDCSPTNVQDYILSPVLGDGAEKQATVYILKERIKEWSFELSPGVPAPIDYENVLRMFQLPGTYAYLLSQLEQAPSVGLSTAEKKT